MPATVRDGAVHPRPQLTRPWTDLSGRWGFSYDDEDIGREEGWHRSVGPYDRSIVVPYPPESQLSGIGDESFHPVVWYRREFDCEADPGHRVWLHLGAVDYAASVWVNGQLVVAHEGGHTPFSADITAALRAGRIQELVVRAEDRPDDLKQPRGKQDWQPQPHKIWYRRTTGIWQPVWFEQRPATHIAGLTWVANVQEAQLSLTVRVRRASSGPLRLRVRLVLDEEVLSDDVYGVVGEEVRRDITLPQVRMTLERERMLWTPERPNLIDATVELMDGDRVLDRVGSYTAMRSVRADNGRFQLNERPYFLRLVLAQGFWPGSHLAAPDADALRREVEIAKSLGFNGVRLHQKIEDPRFLYWCDRLGLLVWAEMPAAYEFSDLAVERITREWLEVLERDRSHPCIIAWVPFNESWGLPALLSSSSQRHLVRALYSLTKAIDLTRPVVGNDGWEQVVSDIVTVHDYSSWGETLLKRYGSPAALDDTLLHVQPSYRSVLLPGETRGQQPVMVTEFGGITFTPRADHRVWNGYGTAADVAAFLARYGSLVDALLESPVVMGFCYTQLTDTLQEQNGLLTERREPKVPGEVIRSINTRISAAVPADAIAQFEVGDYPLNRQEPSRSERQRDRARHSKPAR